MIFGGRNDQTFKEVQNVALNDLHLYHVLTNTWTAIAIYGELASSRWGARLAASDNKLILFGGMNLNNYCESVLYDIKIDNAAVADYLQVKNTQERNSYGQIEADMNTTFRNTARSTMSRQSSK